MLLSPLVGGWFATLRSAVVGGGPAPKTRLVVRHRHMNSTEEGEMTRRLQLLEPLEDEEEEEEGSDGEKRENDGENDAVKNDEVRCSGNGWRRFIAGAISTYVVLSAFSRSFKNETVVFIRV